MVQLRRAALLIALLTFLSMIVSAHTGSDHDSQSSQTIIDDHVTVFEEYDDGDNQISDTEVLDIIAAENDGDIGEGNADAAVTIHNRGYQWEDSNQPPEAELTLPSTATVGEEITISSVDSTDPDGEITASLSHITGGPAEGLTLWNVDGKGGTRHTFSEPGDYQVRLYVEDGDGASDEVTETITVEDQAPQEGGPAITWSCGRWMESATTVAGQAVDLETHVRLEADDGFSDTQSRRYDIAVGGEVINSEGTVVAPGAQSTDVATSTVPADVVSDPGELTVEIRPFSDVQPFSCGSVIVEAPDDPPQEWKQIEVLGGGPTEASRFRIEVSGAIESTSNRHYDIKSEGVARGTKYRADEHAFRYTGEIQDIELGGPWAAVLKDGELIAVNDPLGFEGHKLPGVNAPLNLQFGERVEGGLEPWSYCDYTYRIDLKGPVSGPDPHVEIDLGENDPVGGGPKDVARSGVSNGDATINIRNHECGRTTLPLRYESGDGGSPEAEKQITQLSTPSMQTVSLNVGGETPEGTVSLASDSFTLDADTAERTVSVSYSIEEAGRYRMDVSLNGERLERTEIREDGSLQVTVDSPGTLEAELVAPGAWWNPLDSDRTVSSTSAQINANWKSADSYEEVEFQLGEAVTVAPMQKLVFNDGQDTLYIRAFEKPENYWHLQGYADQLSEDRDVEPVQGTWMNIEFNTGTHYVYLCSTDGERGRVAVTAEREPVGDVCSSPEDGEDDDEEGESSGENAVTVSPSTVTRGGEVTATPQVTGSVNTDRVSLELVNPGGETVQTKEYGDTVSFTVPEDGEPGQWTVRMTTTSQTLIVLTDTETMDTATVEVLTDLNSWEQLCNDRFDVSGAGTSQGNVECIVNHLAPQCVDGVNDQTFHSSLGQERCDQAMEQVCNRYGLEWDVDEQRCQY